MTSHHRAVAALAIAFLVFGAALAGAHEEAAIRALAVIRSVEPAIEGLEVRVVQLTAPVIVVTNDTSDALVILGEKDEPFLRITPVSVETNIRSPMAYRALDPTGNRPLPRGLRPRAEPEWIVLAHEPTWSWFDPRALYSPDDPEWAIPATFGDRTLTINGSFEDLDGHGHFTTRFDPSDHIDALELRIFDGLVPAIFVRNNTGEVLEVPGRAGEPFLQIGPRGVFGNLLSPDFYASGSQSVREVPTRADPAASPRWKKLSDQPVWQWLEYRARLPASAHQRAALGTERKTILSWTTPVRLGTEALELSGHVDWVPPRIPGTDNTRRVVLFAIVAALVGAAVELFWLRPRRRPHP